MSPQAPVEPWWADRSRPNHRKPAARGAGARSPFGTTWWGRAWLEALEHRAGLDSSRLPRGRSYARSGAVGELTVDAGTVRAQVQGSRAAPYAVVIRVPEFGDAEWERVLDAMAGRLGHVAALLDGELPPDVVADVQAVGLSLLPAAGEVVAQCSCPDWAVPCKHAAAVCYLVTDVLDQDPFALLQLRGRERESVLTALRARRGGSAETAAPAADPTLLARDVYAAWRRRAAGGTGRQEPGWTPPAPLPAPVRPGRPAVPVVDPGATGGIDLDGLARLAADTARRAWALALRTGDGGLELTLDEDIARRADVAIRSLDAGDGRRADESASAGRTDDARRTGDLARAAGISARDLTSWAIAWRHGGADGLRVLREPWSPPAADMAAARTAMVAGSSEPVSVRRNRATQGRLQLRLDVEGRWWLFRKYGDQWELVGPSAQSAVAILATHDGTRER